MKTKKRKNSLKLAGLAGLLFLSAVGATLAYFTDHDSASNILTLGHVDITLTEDMKNPENPDGPLISYQDPKLVVPGEDISKMPKITLDEKSLDSYVRAVIEITNPSQIQENGYPVITAANLDIDSEQWVVLPDEQKENRWVCYYIGGNPEGVMTAGESKYLFTMVEVPGEWETACNGSQIKIDVTAEAIQSQGFVPGYERDDQNRIVSVSWKDKQGKPVETEKFEKQDIE